MKTIYLIIILTISYYSYAQKSNAIITYQYEFINIYDYENTNEESNLQGLIIPLDTKNIESIENPLVEKYKTIYQKKGVKDIDVQIQLLTKIKLILDLEEFYLIKYRIIENGNLSNISIIKIKKVNNNIFTELDKPYPELDIFEKLLMFVNVRLLFEFTYNEGDSDIPMINKLIPKVIDENGIILLDTLLRELIKNKKVLEKYIEK